MRHILKVDESVWNEETKKFMKDNCRKRKDGKYVVESNFIDIDGDEIKLSTFTPTPSIHSHVLKMNEKNEVVDVRPNANMDEDKFQKTIEKLLKGRLSSDERASFILRNFDVSDNIQHLWVEEIKKEFLEKGADVEHLHGHFTCGGKLELERGHQQVYDAYRVEDDKIRLTVRVSYSIAPVTTSTQYDFLVSDDGFEIISVQKDRLMYNIVPSENESSVLIESNGFPVIEIRHQFDLGTAKSYEEISSYLVMYLQKFDSLEEAMLHVMTRNKDMKNVPVIHDPWGAFLQKETVKKLIDSK